MRNLLITAGAASALALAVAGPASAAVIYDPATGTGFVGKGDVQTAYDWNNKALQENANSVTFKTEQAARQALTQAATQTGTQTGSQAARQSGIQTGTQTATQVVSQDVSCILENNKVQFHREGVRSASRLGERSATRDGIRTGSRDGERTGIRTGSRDGVLTGTIVSALDGDPRQTKGQNQFTGFILKGFNGEPTFSAAGAPVMSEPTFEAMNYGDWKMGEYTFTDWSFGDYEFGGYTFGETTDWGEWDATPTENPSVCLGGNPNVTDVENTITEGDITEGDVTDGAITEGDVTAGDITPGDEAYGDIAYGDIDYGAVTPSGSATLSAVYNGVSKPLNWPVAPVA